MTGKKDGKGLAQFELKKRLLKHIWICS